MSRVPSGREAQALGTGLLGVEAAGAWVGPRGYSPFTWAWPTCLSMATSTRSTKRLSASPGGQRKGGVGASRASQPLSLCPSFRQSVG